MEPRLYTHRTAAAEQKPQRLLKDDYSASHWHSGDVVLSNITFFDLWACDLSPSTLFINCSFTGRIALSVGMRSRACTEKKPAKEIWIKLCRVVGIPMQSSLHKFWWRSVNKFRVARRQILPFPIDFHHRPYNTFPLYRARMWSGQWVRL